MKPIQSACGLLIALAVTALPACDRNADPHSKDDQPLPVGTRTRGEGPNPDTKAESATPLRTTPSSPENAAPANSVAAEPGSPPANAH